MSDHRTNPTRVALYLRQSSDVDGDELAIKRQREQCLDLVARRGWAVDEARIYIDNNVSASSRKPRPSYQRMVSAVQAGEVDVVVAWNLDRLTRRPRELEDWLDWHEAHGVNLLTSEESELVDLATESGRMMLRIRGAVARQEVERKGRRQKESNAQGRRMGLPAGSRRAFGYTRLVTHAKAVTATRLGGDGNTYPAYGHEPLEPEASAVRRGFDLLLAGSSLASIAREWNDAGLTTTEGAPWSAGVVRAVLANPRYAALVSPPRSSSGRADKFNLGLSDLPEGNWEPLVTPETWAAARKVLSDPARQTNRGAPVRTLLSGIARCGKCGGPMRSGTSGRAAVYRCHNTPHLSRKRDDVDDYITEVVLERLSRPDAVDLLEDRERPDVDALRAQLREAQQGEADVASMVARGLMRMSAAEAALADVRGRIADLEGKLTDAGRADALAPLVRATDARAVWESFGDDIGRKREAIRLLMAPIIHSPGKGTRPPRDPAGRMAHTAASIELGWR